MVKVGEQGSRIIHVYYVVCKRSQTDHLFFPCTIADRG